MGFAGTQPILRASERDNRDGRASQSAFRRGSLDPDDGRRKTDRRKARMPPAHPYLGSEDQRGSLKVATEPSLAHVNQSYADRTQGKRAGRQSFRAWLNISNR